MSYRVCLPTAGTGSRLCDLTRYLNKSLVSIANRPALSHLIEQFPQDTEFVIALGHKGHLVQEFLNLAYPGRTFIFEEVAPFEGAGSGLGLSLLKCREHLQQPFVFLSCDTLVREAVPAPDRNWMGYAERENLAPYRTLRVRGEMVQAICEKGEGREGSHKPYIGLAGIADYGTFWQAMESGGALAVDCGEAYGLRALVEAGIAAHRFTWYDTGNPTSLQVARDAYSVPGAPNILEKANEAIWFVDGQVIKFSDDERFIANRVKRAAEIEGFVPGVSGSTAHMYRYPKARGNVLSEVITLPLLQLFLEHCRQFWKPAALEPRQKREFMKSCHSFYKDKTLERVELFYRNFGRHDGTEPINGCTMPTLSALFEKVDWGWLADGLPGRFHGDFHFENILWSEEDRKFTFLDWRQDFGGSLTTGDVYYDLAKLLHGLIINHEMIAKEHFQVSWGQDSIRYDFHRKQSLVQCERRLERWLADNGYDVGKVRTLTALIYLNIAALHHYPYSLLLFALGKSMLLTEIENPHEPD
ncbi:MAG: phosphotransferase [Geobacter sp.]|nr:MAG: phosphotransferase [Geobacter sp.]